MITVTLTERERVQLLVAAQAQRDTYADMRIREPKPLDTAMEKLRKKKSSR